MKKKQILITNTLIAAALFIGACSSVPVTNRTQVTLVPDSMLYSQASHNYNKVLEEDGVSKDTKSAEIVKEVGKRLQHAVEAFFKNRNQADAVADYSWEFNLIDSNQMNAWCMPGGKVAVYTGILKACENRDGLATVMGHEIAHAIAEHGNERLTQGTAVQILGYGLNFALIDRDPATRNALLAAYGAGAQYGVILPYSRLHELEADRLGLIFMAMAGYNPQEAVKFWERMSSSKKGEQPAEFASTHPSDTTRIEQIKKYLPEAMRYYNSSQKVPNATLKVW